MTGGDDMFVATHEVKETFWIDESGYIDINQQVYLSKLTARFHNTFGVICEGEGQIFELDNKYIEYFEPILLTCPYCNTEIQQAERVECECGWIAEAISNDQYNYWEGFLEFYEVDAFIDEFVQHINDLHWLEFKSGKERK